MKKFFVAQINEGDRVNTYFLVEACHQRYTKNNKVYLKLVLADKTGRIEAVMWDETMEKSASWQDVKAGDFVIVDGQATKNRYNNKVEIVLEQVQKVANNNLNPADFLPTTSKDVQKLQLDLLVLCQEVTNPFLKKLLNKIFSREELLDKFCLAPAAKNFHHAYLGGLLEHSVSVAKLAVLLCQHYQELDKSLLIAGALLHDIGKVYEFSYERKIDYSTEGRLKGHIVMGEQLVAKYIEKIKNFPEELKLQLSHLILSHQGEPEYGAAVKPKTKEAVVLNFIDNVDAKINGFLEIAKKYDAEAEWTEFQTMFNDYLYLGKPSLTSENELSQQKVEQELTPGVEADLF